MKAVNPVPFLASTTLACVCAAQPTLTELTTGTPWDMSADGSVVLGSDATGLFLWTSGGGKQYLGQSVLGGFPRVSADGKKVVSTIPDANGDQFGGYYDGSTWTQVGFLGGKSGNSFATGYGISGDGNSAVGLGWISGSMALAFHWTPALGSQPLPTNGDSGRANDVDFDGGVIVGFENHPVSGFRRAARWVNGVLLNDAPEDPSEYYGVSDDGAVCVGTIGNNAARWTSGTGVVDLGILPGTSFFGSAIMYATNADGSAAVGFNLFDFGPFAARAPIYWTEATGMVNLETYITGTLGLTIPAGVDLRDGQAISADGSKILIGARLGFSDARIYLLDLGFGGCYADCDGSGSLDFFDFLCFQNEFGSMTAYADCDGSGTLDFFDFLCFQNEFNLGCP